MNVFGDLAIEGRKGTIEANISEKTFPLTFGNWGINLDAINVKFKEPSNSLVFVTCNLVSSFIKTKNGEEPHETPLRIIPFQGAINKVERFDFSPKFVPINNVSKKLILSFRDIDGGLIEKNIDVHALVELKKLQ